MKRASLLLVLAGSLFVGAQAGDKAGGVRETPAGFTSLFNGKDLAGWKNTTAWEVADGAIHYTGKGGANLASAKNYKDFELWVDWKITPKGDSGIYLRGKPQIQIWDNKEGSGGLYNNPAKSDGREPLHVVDKKPGQWNSMYVKMVGAKVTVVLNNKIVVDNAIFLEGKALAEGPIELQVHGSPLWFRNVFVREIPGAKK